ncbi:vomeronasal type-2 receptor 26-like [Anolis sagrei]|uniref:vomeronasal type-2 receptor 26-like n=1 Tax=Anolis sagrei TaxID=38937 RepID=UPI003521D4C3
MGRSLRIHHKYHMSGDLHIGAILSQIFMSSEEISLRQDPVGKPQGDTINFLAGFTYLASLELLSTWGKFVPNYKCDTQDNPAAVIGGPTSNVCLFMAHILCAYKFAQLTYGSAPLMDNKKEAVFFHHMFPNETHQYTGILDLILHFQWMWIGVIYLDNEIGQRFVHEVIPMFVQKGICFDFIKATTHLNFFSDMETMAKKLIETSYLLGTSTAKVVILNGEVQSIVALRMWLEITFYCDLPKINKVWIMTAEIDFASLPVQRDWDLSFIHGALSVSLLPKKVSGFHEFLQNRKPGTDREDGFIRDFWQQAFMYSFPGRNLDESLENICTEEDKLETLPMSVFEMSMSSHSYSIYNAVYAVAHALHDMDSSNFKRRTTGITVLPEMQPWQLHHFLKSVIFNNTVGEKISFNKNGELVAGFDIINWVTFPNKTFSRVKVGRIDPQSLPTIEFTVHEDAIVWPSWFNQAQPVSLCNDNCYPGYSKRKKEGEPFCCYDCIPCPEGKISTKKDVDACFQCPEDHYPNKFKDFCNPKSLIFLTFEDALGTGLACSALLLVCVTAGVLGIFIKHRDTPIVKANNRSLTYTLLLSLLLSFLCALLFIGQPQKVTCLFRQTAFGVIFSLAVSSVLAKTIIVILAFQTTKPVSHLRKWLGKRTAASIILFCLLIQVTICTVWLATFPPFPDFDVNSMAEEVILECNEGSVSMFYCVLGFMGFLSICSFTSAFFARKLPDSFNEAKFITFSMLVFCSVWISFVPTYLSTKGKYTVAVEIFSILASSTGLLGFIFFPKCYTIVMRPDMNIRKQLINRKL